MLRQWAGIIAWLNISGLVWYAVLSQQMAVGAICFWLLIAAICAVAPRSGVMDK